MNEVWLSAMLIAVCATPSLWAATQPKIKIQITTTKGAWANFTGPGTPNADLAALNGKIYIVGGGREGKMSADLIEFDPVRSEWRNLSPMPTARRDLAVGVINGKLLAVGGMDGQNVLTTVEEYDPKTDRWSERAKMPTARSGFSVAVTGGVLYAVGGWDGAKYLNTVEAYEPKKDRWTTKAPLLFAAETKDSLIPLGKYLVLVKGFNGQCVGIQSYSPAADAWKLESTYSIGGEDCNMPAVLVNGNVLAFSAAGVSIYNPESWVGSWSLAGIGHSHGAATVLQDKVFLIGGSSGGAITMYSPGGDFTVAQDDKKPQEPSPTKEQPRIFSDIGPPEFWGDERPHDIALIIGVEKYKSLPDADFGSRDAEMFRDIAEQSLGVPKNNIALLIGSTATKAQMDNFIEQWLAEVVHPDSRVYFFFSGHGAPDPTGKKVFLVPWDGDPKYLKTTGYPVERLYSQLSKLPAKEILVMLDSCFSGLGGKSVIMPGIKPLVNVVDTGPVDDPRISVLTAASGSEVAGTEKSSGHGLFSYYLFKGLMGHDGVGRNGHLSIEDLHQYIEKSVIKAAHDDGRDQTPQLIPMTAKMDIY